jgi:adenosylcobinamide-GDP ribazoletransferase
VAGLIVATPRPAAPAGIAAGLVGGALVVALARRRLGGYTGDVLGAVGIVVETVALLVIAA